MLGQVANVVGVIPVCLESSLMNRKTKLELRDLLPDLSAISGKYPHQSEGEYRVIEFGKCCHLFRVLRSMVRVHPTTVGNMIAHG
jgi:hypothetical protein